MFPLTFSFHDSEVKHIRQAQHTVRVGFSAARVHSAAQIADGFDGYALGLELQLIGVIRATASPHGFGRLSGGSVSVGGPGRSCLVLPSLPFEWVGTTQLELHFSQGDVWAADTLSLRIDWESGERFLEQRAC